MSLSRDKKLAVVTEVSQTFSGAQVAILADYRGLTVGQISELRTEARNSGVVVRVVKNTLARRSVVGSEFECLADHFVGPVLLASSQDPVAVAKVVSRFAKSNDTFKVKVGAMGGDLIDSQVIERLAALPNREELLASLIGTLRAPLDKFFRTLNEVPSKFARTLAAVRDGREAL
jgi:large subunit ribosomal protein L10